MREKRSFAPETRRGWIRVTSTGMTEERGPRPSHLARGDLQVCIVCVRHAEEGDHGKDASPSFVIPALSRDPAAVCLRGERVHESRCEGRESFAPQTRRG